MLDERPPPCASRPSGAVDTVEEFADSDDADCAIFVADEFLDGGTFLLVEHEQIGVD
jgi:hypothetical protein